MNKENIQMVVGVVVVLFLSFFNGAPADISLEPETAMVVDSIDEVTAEESVTPSTQSGDTAETPRDESQEVQLPESFNESDLEDEFGDVQAGIDLLDNPLQ